MKSPGLILLQKHSVCYMREIHTKCQYGGGDKAKESLTTIQGRAQTHPMKGVPEPLSSFLRDKKIPLMQHKS